MSKKRRMRAEGIERHRDRKVTQKKDQQNGITPTDTATTRGLLKAFWVAAQFSIEFIIVFILFIRLMSWLSVLEWSKSRCQLLSPSSLKTADLKSLLEERGLSASEHSRLVVEAAVYATGGVMEIEMEPFLEPGNDTQRDAVRYKTWNEFKKNVSQQIIGVYLVLRSAELERSTSELILWRQFLHRLSENGVKFVFVACDDFGDCVKPKVTLLPIWISKGFKKWNYFSYAGQIQPSDIFQWITETLSDNVLRADSANDVFRHPDRLTHSMVAHSTRPLPLSYAVLASDLRGRVSFFWVETLDKYLTSRASLMVLRPESYVVYHSNQFLNQREIRWLVRLMTMDHDDMYELFSSFVVLVAVTIPLMAGKSFWQKVKAIFSFLLLCVLAIVLHAFWTVRLRIYTTDVMQFLAAMFTALIEYFRPDLLLIFHLFSQYPRMRLIVLVYALVAVFYARIIRFFEHLFSDSKNSDPPKPRSVKTVPTTKLTLMLLKVVKAAAHINSNITKAIINVPIDAAKTIAKISYNITMATINVPLDAAKTIAKNASSIINKANNQMPQNTVKTVTTMLCGVTVPRGGADGRKGYETNDPSAPNQRLKSVAQSQSLQRQRSSRRANTRQQLPGVSNGTIRDYPTIHPFEYPPLMNSVNRYLDKTATEQMVRRKIPKVSHQPIISDKELRLSTALHKSESRDPRSFEPASRTVPRCFYCKTDFQPTSEVRVLACREIFHPECMDKWMKEGNIDCPICQYYATDRMFLS